MVGGAYGMSDILALCYAITRLRVRFMKLYEKALTSEITEKDSKAIHLVMYE